MEEATKEATQKRHVVAVRVGGPPVTLSRGRLAYRTLHGAQPHRQLPSPAAALEPRGVAASLEA